MNSLYTKLSKNKNSDNKLLINKDIQKDNNVILDNNKFNLNNSYIDKDFSFINYNMLNKEKERYSEHKFFSEIINKVKNQPESIQNEIITIINILDSENINLKKLKEYSFKGLDESPTLRSLIWKLLLNYLPNNINKWEESLLNSRKKYENIKLKAFDNNKVLKDHINKMFDRKVNNNCVKKSKINLLDIKENTIKDAKNINLKDKIKVKIKSHPLEIDKESERKMNLELKEKKLYDEIYKDALRTKSYMNFFNQVVNYETNQTGCEILTNILYIYSYENSCTFESNYNNNNNKKESVKTCNIKPIYSQGMNELAASILYCFSMDNNPYFKKYIEHDTYYCFSIMFSSLIEWYENDYINVPIKIREIENTLKQSDEALYTRIKTINLDLQFFLIRWITLCFSQEYELPEILRIWDSALAYYEENSNKTIEKFMKYYALSLLKISREKIIFGDFADAMIFIQEDVSSINIDKVIDYLNKNYIIN